MLKLRIIFFILGAFLSIQDTNAQRRGFMDHLRIGFGAGANSSHILDLQSYNIFEDLTGASYENSYSGPIQNIGNQYFVQAEYYNDYLIISLKPGTYTHRFSKINEIIFTNETVEQVSPYLLRYLSVPVEARYNFDLLRFRPYAGIGAAYSHLLGSHDASNQTFIRPKISAGAVAGTYVDLTYVTLDLNVGYHAAVHNIARKTDRFETGSGFTFAQDDILLNNLQISLSILFSLQKQTRFSNVECYY